ncbi:pyridoxamine 5'-phosphate oxidase-domain-containing protein [Pilaira anomala]|nr:pyridoxamine 5'-phosphate oxidase-domain-containing protein [Pilaira anomala]
MVFYVFILFTLIAVTVQGQPVNSLQSVQVAAQLARRIVSDAGRGTILTLMHGTEFDGFPFGIMEYYSDKCNDNGNLLLFMSDLQLSAKNMHGNSKKIGFTINALKDYNPSYGNHSTPVQQPRFTLFGNIKSVPESKSEESMKCFVQTHPEAKPWNSFHDFHFYEFQVQNMYYVGGFGGINYIGWIPAHIYRNAHPHKLLIQDN